MKFLSKMTGSCELLIVSSRENVEQEGCLGSSVPETHKSCIESRTIYHS